MYISIWIKITYLVSIHLFNGLSDRLFILWFVHLLSVSIWYMDKFNVDTYHQEHRADEFPAYSPVPSWFEAQHFLSICTELVESIDPADCYRLHEYRQQKG